MTRATAGVVNERFEADGGTEAVVELLRRHGEAGVFLAMQACGSLENLAKNGELKALVHCR